MELKHFFAKGNRTLQVFVGIALISEFSYLAIFTLGNLKNQIPIFLILFGISFVAYWIAVFYFFNFSKSEPTPKSQFSFFTGKYKDSFSWLNDFIKKYYTPKNLTTKEILTIGIFFGLIFRITILFTTPSLSDDIYRYIWDGRVSTQNINPYSPAPESEELLPLRDDPIYTNVNHKDIPTIYPPVAQMIFHGISTVKPSLIGFKTGFLIFDLGTAFLLVLILRKFSINPARMLIYFWNPLVIMEIAGSGHMDIIGIFFMVLMFYFIVLNKLNLANAALVLSFLTKFLSLIFLPVLFFLKKQTRLVVPLFFIILAAAFYIPYADAGANLFSGLRTYAAKWEWNASVFALLKNGFLVILTDDIMTTLLPILYWEIPIPEAIASRKIDLALLLTKCIIVAGFASLVFHFGKRFGKDIAEKGQLWPVKLGMIFMGYLIICMSTVHPWYVCWIVPFLAIIPNRAWLLLSGLVMLSYWNLTEYGRTGLWQEPTVVKFVEYLPFFFLLLFDYFRSRTKAPDSLT